MPKSTVPKSSSSSPSTGEDKVHYSMIINDHQTTVENSQTQLSPAENCISKFDREIRSNRDSNCEGRLGGSLMNLWPAKHSHSFTRSQLVDINPINNNKNHPITFSRPFIAPHFSTQHSSNGRNEIGCSEEAENHDNHHRMVINLGPNTIGNGTSFLNQHQQ